MSLRLHDVLLPSTTCPLLTSPDRQKKQTDLAGLVRGAGAALRAKFPNFSEPRAVQDFFGPSSKRCDTG
jgi:hypothetical protein